MRYGHKEGREKSRSEQQQHRRMMVCVNALSWELVQISGAQKETPETELENPRA